MLKQNRPLPGRKKFKRNFWQKAKANNKTTTIMTVRIPPEYNLIPVLQSLLLNHVILNFLSIKKINPSEHLKIR